jgi:predicted transcriptional regulator
MPSRKSTTVYLDPRLHRALRLRARATDCTISEVIGEALRQALATEARRIQADRVPRPGTRMSLAAVGARLKRRPKG